MCPLRKAMLVMLGSETVAGSKRRGLYRIIVDEGDEAGEKNRLHFETCPSARLDYAESIQ